ncbi:membrane protein [Rhodopirellula maiorica SM1]|uniref:Membrane protein n=1 Tax=Rhodopirellula maiorica SM1 TaxID=1265738 RepID=M5RER4_9BACT|nr:membrane protein [Rhodopirellula maiorica SM1]
MIHPVRWATPIITSNSAATASTTAAWTAIRTNQTRPPPGDAGCGVFGGVVLGGAVLGGAVLGGDESSDFGWAVILSSLIGFAASAFLRRRMKGTDRAATNAKIHFLA